MAQTWLFVFDASRHYCCSEVLHYDGHTSRVRSVAAIYKWAKW